MNGKDLLLGMSFISEELVQEADSQPIKTSTQWKKWLSLAACLCLILGAAGLFGSMLPSKDSTRQETALLDNNLAAGGNSANGLLNDQHSPQYSMNESCSETVTQDPVTAVTDFGIRLLQNTCSEGENTLLSPLSVVYALGMTANGARGETLAQMEAAMGISAATLNEWIRDYTNGLPQTDGGRLLSANGIWYRDRALTVSDAFQKVNKAYYRADIHAAAFDQETLHEINGWVDKNTKGMIPSIIDEIPPESVMYLINALAFEAEWETVYREDQVYRDTFTTESGQEQLVDFLHGEERDYLENELSTGFIKYYKDRNYAFAALLPNEDVTVAELVTSLDGESLRTMLENPTDITVCTSIPKFKTEYAAELSGTLQKMGMELPFDDSLADFSGIGTAGNAANIYISKIIHKTFLQLDEQGTRAGAATAVTMFANGALMDVKYVELDRPFVYMLIDCQSGLPFFIGCMMDVNP